jgi:uncharacterized protein (TIGR03067 family)
VSTHLLILPALFLLTADDKTKKDDDAFQGSWSVVKYVDSGKDEDEVTRKQLTIAFKGDAMEVLVAGKTEETYRFKLDSSKKPRHIDIFEKKEKSDPLQGLYELDGDTLKICWNKEAPDKGRPTEFNSTDKNKWHLMVLKRKGK